ncbi:MAG: hypothetical protein ACHQX1_03490 [Candidatus Micrarchaeales archaeon]
MNINSKLGVNIFKILAIFFLYSSCLSTISSAQLGEIGGQLHFNIIPGQSQSIQWTLLNEGNTSISVQMLGPAPTQLQLTSNAMTSANQIPPTVYLTPANATIPEHSTVPVNITVFMPYNDTPGLASWEGILSAQEYTNQTNPGGAVIIEGVAKILTIASIKPPPPPTTSTIAQQGILVSTPTPSSSATPIAGAALLIVAILLGYGYYKHHRGGKPTKKSAKKGAKPDKQEEMLKREIAKLKREKAQLQTQVKKGGRAKGSSKAKGKKKSTTRRRRRR